MDANTYSQFLAEEREWDLRALSSERFLRQLRLAHSLGLLAVLLAEANRQDSRQTCRLAASNLTSPTGNQSSFAPEADLEHRPSESEPMCQ